MKLRSLLLAAALGGALAAPAAVPGRWFDTPPAPTPAAPGPAPTAVPAPGPSCEIDVLEREPAVPFDLLAVVEVQARVPGNDDAGLVESARIRACQLGGDALVVLWRRHEPRSGMAPSPAARGILPEPGLRAAVIRYR